MKATGRSIGDLCHCLLASSGARSLASGAAALLALLATGCLGMLHPVRCPQTPQCVACSGLPACCCRHVHIFFVNGLDPLDYCNLKGLAGYCNQLGFANTYRGQLFHGKHFHKQIVRIHQEDPDSRFVLVGFSFGANVMRDMALELQREGIDVDLLVYYGGNTLENEPRSKPENAGHVVNILAHGYIWHGARIDGAENYQLEDVWHFGSPTHRVSLEVLGRELMTIALRVPMTREDLIQTHVTAKPPNGSVERDEWDFLKPSDRLAPLVEATKMIPSER
jgi:hypothetical protein